MDRSSIARARRRAARPDRRHPQRNGRRLRPPAPACRERSLSGSIPFIGAFESTYQPAFDRDGFETTGHLGRWREDIELLRSCGVREIRYPVRWHRIEAEPGAFDWRQTDEMLGYLQDAGLRTIVDLVHHTSYPRWIEHFADPAFGPALLRYVRAFAERYPGVEAYTIFNEPFTTFLLCGHVGIWPPRLHGLEGFVAVARNVFPALTDASRLLRELLPEARHFYVDACERHTSSSPAGARFAEWTNDRRFFLTDLFLGRELERSRPFVADVVACGGADLLDVEPGEIDVLGLDYYAHNQWEWSDAHVGTTSPSAPVPFADVIIEYWERYRLPCIVGETNIRGFSSDRATWLKYTLEQCERARDAGVPVEGYCWFPFVDSCDWDSILCRCDGNVDPVGVYSLDDELNRNASSMSASYRLAASGSPAAELPAYELQPPVGAWLAGWLPQMAHWRWEAPPAAELAASGGRHHFEIELRVVEAPVELVVFSHLRWTFVWQRPQQLISRLAQDRRTWFVEEPLPSDVPEPVLRTERNGPVTRVWLEVPSKETHLDFGGTDAAAYEELLGELLGRRDGRIAWLYTPMAFSLAQSIEHDLLVYDVMDDLASFRDADPGLRFAQRQSLRAADVVFTGGRSLQRSVAGVRPDAHLFASGVEPEHYAVERSPRAEGERPVAGYVGVIDERIDLDLVDDLAAALSGWEIRMVGPVAKIDPATLPRRDNITYPGAQPYERLPHVLAGFDVALMPFALNESTRSISPTKTLEYLAAGLPVVSTRVPDVVADYASVVALADDAEGFAVECLAALQSDSVSRRARIDALLRLHHWDAIAARMDAILVEAAAARAVTRPAATEQDAG